MEYYMHEVPGRLRIKIPALKRDAHRAREIQRAIRSVSGVRSTSANTLTGSVTVHYDPEQVRAGMIVAHLSREEYIDVAQAMSRKPQTDTALSRAGQTAAKVLLGLAMDRLLQGSPLGILTAFI
jgi:hypothetical protein